MGRAGARPASSPGRCWCQAGHRQPALDRSHVRQRGTGELTREVDAQQAGAPTRVVATQRDDMSDVIEVGVSTTRPVARRMRAGATGAKRLQEVADGTRREAELIGERDGVGIGVGEGSLPQGIANRQGNGGRHGGILGVAMKGPSHTLCGIDVRGKTSCLD